MPVATEAGTFGAAEPIRFEIRVRRSYLRQRNLDAAQAQGAEGEQQRKTQLENVVSDCTTGMKIL
jgi:hypothetical protein